MSDATQTGETPGRRRFSPAAALGYALLTLLLTSQIRPPADDFGDPSFQQALGYFLLNGMQAGQDYIFTYGPLGHFLVPRFQPGLFWMDWSVGLGMGLLAAWPVFVLLKTPTFGIVERAAALIAFLFSASAGPGPETPYLLSAFVMLVLIRRRVVVHPGAIAAFAAALAFLSLGKFTLMVVAVGFAGYAALQFAVDGRYRDAVTILSAYAVSLIVLWLLAGQAMAHFPPYIVDSIEIARAYNAGMALDGSATTQVLGAIAVIAALLATLPNLPFERVRLRAVFDTILVLVYVFILWKSGMVRQHAHEIKLFLPALLVPLVIGAPDVVSPLVRATRHAAVAALLIVSSVGYVIAAGNGVAGAVMAPVNQIAIAGYQTVLPWMRHDALADRWRELGVYDAWPRTRTHVNGRTIDVFPPEHRVLLISEFNYWPRYVFQGYQACTRELLERNGDSYWGAEESRPPDFVLYRSMPIDHRFPYMEDSQALLGLYYCYSPVLLERGLVLFERKDDPPRHLPDPMLISEGLLPPNATLEVPQDSDRWQLLSLKFSDAHAGWFGRNTDYLMSVEYADGRSKEFRVLPEMTDLPFLLNRFWDASTPVHQNNDYGEDRVVSLRIHTEDDSTDWTVSYRLTAIDPPGTP